MCIIWSYTCTKIIQRCAASRDDIATYPNQTTRLYIQYMDYVTISYFG